MIDDPFGESAIGAPQQDWGLTTEAAIVGAARLSAHVESIALRPKCQSALEWDPLSAFKRDPFGRVLTVALAPSELVGVAETARVRAV